jgi:hypothetical protein
MAVDDVEAAISAGLADMALGDLGSARDAQSTIMSLNIVDSATGAQPSDSALEDAQISTAVHDLPFRFLDLAARKSCLPTQF